MNSSESHNSGEQLPDHRSTSFPMDELSARTEEYLNDPALQKRINERTSPWYGKRLYENTNVRRMELNDIPLVGEAYMSDLIPIEFFDALGNPGEESKVVRMMVKQRGGMLNRFEKPPIAVDSEKYYPSVQQEMEQRISQGYGKIERKDRRLASYRGQILTPKDDQARQEALSWITYQVSTRSKRNRTTENDASVKEVERTLMSMHWEAGRKKMEEHPLMRKMKKVAIVDTQHARYPGAADLVFLEMCKDLGDRGYEYILLWRNKTFELLNMKDENIDLGNNERSYKYFVERGFREIGTLLSPYAAVRGKAAGEASDNTYLVQPKRAHMYAKLTTAQECTEASIKESKDKFAA